MGEMGMIVNVLCCIINQNKINHWYNNWCITEN